MNGLNLSFKNIPGGDQLGFDAGSGVSAGGHSLASTLSNSSANYFVPPPPSFWATSGNPGSGVSSGAGLGNYGSDQNDALQVLNAANSRGKFETIASLVSQTLAGVLPRATQQVGGQTVPNYQSQGQVLTSEQLYALQVQQQLQNQGNGGAGDTVNQLVNFVSNNPLAVGGVCFAFYLLMREPPKRR